MMIDRIYVDVMNKIVGPYDVSNFMRVVLFIHTNDVGWNVGTFSRGCNDDLFRPGLDVLPSPRTIHENTSPLYIKVLVDSLNSISFFIKKY